MQVVGKHLSDFASRIRGTSPDDGLFARSAFNRYYYATFLASRRLLIETTGAGGLAHKALPEYLIGQFQKTLKRQIQAGFKSGVLSPAGHARMLDALKENTLLLRDLLVLAYSVRVLADYEPDVPVEVKDETYILGASTLSAASNWASRAQMHCKNLHKIWKDLGN
jgi:hypothetical protein